MSSATCARCLRARARARSSRCATATKRTCAATSSRTLTRSPLPARSHVYVGVAARRSTHTRGKDAIRRVWTLWADLDDVDADERLDELPVAPAIVVASGSARHLHAYWPLARPVSITAAETANRRLAAQLHTDTGAVTNAATILRAPGTYSFKTDPPTPVVLERLDTELTTLYAATAGVAADPTPPVCTAAPAPTARPGEDPLRPLDPAHYVSALTGQPVGRSRKISCPFHEDPRHSGGGFCDGEAGAGYSAPERTRTLDSHACRLRTKLSSDGGDWIANRRDTATN
jgi:hypothetical protein